MSQWIGELKWSPEATYQCHMATWNECMCNV